MSIQNKKYVRLLLDGSRPQSEGHNIKSGGAFEFATKREFIIKLRKMLLSIYRQELKRVNLKSGVAGEERLFEIDMNIIENEQ